MAKIRLLTDHLVSQIAAGEVVERPASIVKELVENALDAGARKVVIELEVGGKRRIQVRDDGLGMGREDALLAFDRHATSKIATFEDLQRVGTLGFRGEALASIAAVAKVELTTAEGESGEACRVRIEGGRVIEAVAAARPRGTTVEVRSLFYNVPARRKFLKQTATELRHCVEMVQGYALSRPGVAFELRHDGRPLLQAQGAPEGSAGLRARVREIFGGGLEELLRPIPETRLSEAIRVFGLVGDRQSARGRRIFVFVNRRLLRDRAILAVFYRAVREQWKSDAFPALFLFLELPAAEVDVNVHPQKAEVRFRDPRFLPRLQALLETVLAQARGEEEAALQPIGEGPRPAPAWSGLGRAPWDQEIPATTGEVAEAPSQPRLAQVSYAPSAGSTVRLSGRRGEERTFRLLGQYKGTLVLLEGGDGLYLVDQHVAHERVLYERIRRALEGESVSSQRLLEPLMIELAAGERMRLLEWRSALAECGFALVAMSGRTVGVTSVPASLGREDAERMLREIASEDPAGPLDGGGLKKRLLDALAAGMSCRSAVKMHHPLSVREMEELMAQLFATQQPYACPHGRPIVLKMDDRDLERRFGRS